MIDILMITYNRAPYTRLSLSRLLETCDESVRVWIWQNGSDPETLEVVSGFRDHPRVFRFRHSEENRKLRDPTNWLLSESDGEFVSKVDDDCLVPVNWLEVLRKAHEDEPRLGAIGCWRFMPEDFRPELAQKKIREFRGTHKILVHPWVEGSGFLLKRDCVRRIGLLREKESGITGYLTRVALAGWTNGWYYPFLWQEHMDDPRAPHTLIRTDDDLQKFLPLSARNFGATTVQAWDARLRRSAEELQRLPSSPRYYAPWRAALRRRVRRVLPSSNRTK
ncbi:MAG: glycosyltransferase family A protein [Planctomycetota bacterium]